MGSAAAMAARPGRLPEAGPAWRPSKWSLNDRETDLESICKLRAMKRRVTLPGSSLCTERTC